MSLQKGLEQLEPHFRKRNRQGESKHSGKWWKKLRNRWLRRTKKNEIPNTKIRKGWEY